MAPPRSFTYYYFIRENSLRISDAERELTRFKKINTVKSGATNNLVNQRGRVFKIFLKNFHNVASKYLSFYINWFVVFILEDNRAFNLFRKFVLGEKQLRIEDFNGVNYKGEIDRKERFDERLITKASLA